MFSPGAARLIQLPKLLKPASLRLALLAAMASRPCAPSAAGYCFTLLLASLPEAATTTAPLPRRQRRASSL